MSKHNFTEWLTREVAIIICQLFISMIIGVFFVASGHGFIVASLSMFIIIFLIVTGLRFLSKMIEILID